LKHANLVKYVQQRKGELIEVAGTSPSNVPYVGADASSSTFGGGSTSSKIFLESSESLLLDFILYARIFKSMYLKYF